MEKSFSESYAAAGVDVTAGYESVELIKSHVKKQIFPALSAQSAASAVCLKSVQRIIRIPCSSAERTE